MYEVHFILQRARVVDLMYTRYTTYTVHCTRGGGLIIKERRERDVFDIPVIKSSIQLEPQNSSLNQNRHTVPRG